MTSVEEAKLGQLPQRIKQLEAIEREYIQLKELLNDAARDNPLENHADSMILYAQPDNRQIVDSNAHALKFLGYTLDELLVLTIDKIEVQGSRNQVVTYVESSTEILVYDCYYRHRDGYELPVQVRNWQISQNNEPLLCYTLEDKSLRTQLWHELSRREDAEYQFREKLKTLNEIAIELGQLDSFEDICWRGIEFGMQKLGFDRLSFWFFDSTRKLMTGTFGVDEEGRIRDERGQSWAFAGTYIEDFTRGKHDPVITRDGAPLYNERSEIVGYGWHLSVPILDGSKFIGFIGADNFIRKQALKNYQPELLCLYGATIGHLIARHWEQETIRNLSSAIQHSSSMIMVLNKAQVIEFVNEAFCQRSGYSLTEILGQTLALFLPTEALQTIQQTILSGHDWQGELVNKKKSGERYESLVSISPVRSGDTIENFVLVQEDITLLNRARQKELALQLEQERTQMLETFVSDIGHELKTPLAIINTSNYLLDKSQDEKKRKKYVDQIEAQVKILNQMLDEILEIVNFTRAPNLKTELINLDEFMQRVMDSFAPSLTAKQLVWHAELHSKIFIQVDSSKLELALRELIENAIQFTSAKGMIAVRLQVYEKQVGIVIQDTGIGIASDEVEKIFNRFYRVDKARTLRGTGLGLTLAKLLIEAHQGRIVVESVPEQGSRFEILLPLENH